jgi:hypothetical protein
MAARYKNFGAEVKNLRTLLPDLLKRVEATPSSDTAAAVLELPIRRLPRCRRAPSSRR